MPNASLANLEGMFGKWKEPEKKARKADGGKKSGGGPTQSKTCVSEKGKKFVSLVIDSEKRGRITTADALGYLSIKLNNLDKVGAEIGR